MTTDSRPGTDLSADDRAALLALRARINTLLPPAYQDRYDEVCPSSMGSASLAYGPDGKVAWDRIWSSFCELALAGGPAHRGTLLGPAPAEEALADPERYNAVVTEIARGILLVTGLPVLPNLAPGWVGVRCASEEMALWMMRAIVVENVLARRERTLLHLPAGPAFRLEKEVKNVVTSVAKTHHYWAYHLPARLREPLTTLLEPATAEEALSDPDRYQAVVERISAGVRDGCGLPVVACSAAGWVGVQCETEAMAVWLLRAVLVEDVLARRERAVLCLPASPRFAEGEAVRKVVAALTGAHRLWTIQRGC